jgi:hypothetical protein
MRAFMAVERAAEKLVRGLGEGAAVPSDEPLAGA